MLVASWLACIAASYVIGGIPFGVMIGQAHGVDVRTLGSKNVGATNVGRVLGRRWGFLCFFLDSMKGAIPVLAAGWMSGVLGRSAAESGALAVTWWLAVAAAALVGHIFSPFLKFRGGKGVATGFGALVSMWPLLTLPICIALFTWMVVVKAFRYMSLASMSAAAVLPLAVLAQIGFWEKDCDTTSFKERLLADLPILIAALLMATLVIYSHRSNIGRLLRGEEFRIGSGIATPRPTP